MLPGDPWNVNLVHRDEQTAFGTLSDTKRSIAFYLWPQLTDTWLRTVAVVDPEQVGHAAEMAPLALGAQLTLQGDTAELVPQSALCDRM